jgi:ferredoxin-NADP reductase
MATLSIPADRPQERGGLGVVGDIDLDPRQRLAERDHLAVAAGSGRAPDEGHQQRLEQVRLARAVRAVEERHLRPELDLLLAEVPKSQDAHTRRQHGAA